MFGFQTFGKRIINVAAKSYNMQTKFNFSNSLAWANMESTSLLFRSAPVPNLGLMNIMNLRELIQRCKQEAELQPNTSIPVCDIIVKGINTLRTIICSSIVIDIADNVGINLCAVTKNITTMICRLSMGPLSDK